MKNNFWKIANAVIKESDIILLILDARMPEMTRNKEIENKVKANDKKLIYVINKSDLIDKKINEKYKKRYKPSIFVSSIKHHGSTMLRKKIMQIGKGENIKVGVLGYPNVGKSSVINMLKGHGSAGVAPISGYTKGIQKIRISKKVVLIDTPGVIPYMEKDKNKQTLIGTINFDKIKDPENTVLEMIENFDGLIEKHYNIKTNPDDDSEEILEKIALSKNKIRKGRVPDTNLMAKLILKDWQNGKIR